MSAQTAISWCDSTFNYVIGCTEVSLEVSGGGGCDNCYARELAKRYGWAEWGPGKPRVRTSAANRELPLKWNRRAGEFAECLACGSRSFGVPRREFWTCQRCGEQECRPARRRVFGGSLCDWLDNEWPIEWLVDYLDVIRRTPNLDWLLLSKRIGNWRSRLDAAQTHVVARNGGGIIRGEDAPLCKWLDSWRSGRPPAHVWIGATIVNDDEMRRDGHKLVQVPAAVRFTSAEPLLSEIRIPPVFIQPIQGTSQHGQRFIDWVIAGGESGPKARPMHPDWVRSLRDQCAAAGVAFHLKQWGEWRQSGYASGPLGEWEGEYKPVVCLEGKPNWHPVMVKVGKKAAGRLLDGRTWDEFPRAPA